jgi:hypothetical protein
MRSEAAPPLAARWIKANAIAALVSAASSLAVFGLRQLFGVSGPAGLGASAAFLLGAAVLYGVSGAAWGVLTGAVLQRIVPALPVRAWIMLHTVLTCVVLAGSEFLILAATQSLLRVPVVGATDPMPMHEVALLSLALGGTAGVVIGPSRHSCCARRPAASDPGSAGRRSRSRPSCSSWSASRGRGRPSRASAPSSAGRRSPSWRRWPWRC